MHFLDELCAQSGDHHGLKAKKLSIRAVYYLINDRLGKTLDAVTDKVAPSVLRVQHWWVEIETEDPDVWYCAQFEKREGEKSSLALSAHTSQESVALEGEKAAGRLGKNPKQLFSEKLAVKEGVTMGKMHAWMKAYDSKYNLLTHNCQHFATDFSNHFSSEQIQDLQRGRSADV